MNSNGILLIRADASTQIGAGHVMRCLALAQAWQDSGREAHFAAIELPDGLATRLMAEKITLHQLTAAAGSHEDAVQLAELAREVGADWVVEDGYHFGAEYQSVVKDAGLRLLVVDDYEHAKHYAADLILNQNIYANASLYSRREVHTHLLLGPVYVLLRRDFLQWRAWHRKIPDMACKLLVAMGGSDPHNHTAKVIQAVRSVPNSNLEVVVVVGSSNPNLHVLEDAVVCCSHIKLVHNAANMPELMAWADLAISAGGSTCWELAFMGTPALILVLADNQQAVADSLSSAHIAVSLGNAYNVSPSEISAHLTELLSSRTLREEMSRKGRSLIDGYGAARTVNQLMRKDLSNNKDVTIRQALPEDAEDLWRLSNDPSVRAWSFSPQPIPLASHLEWYKQKLGSSASLMWIAECEGMFAGQIRYDRIDDTIAEIGISVVASLRGRGIGRVLLARTRAIACRRLNVPLVRGVICDGNSASANMFRSAGFDLTGTCETRGRSSSVFTWQCEIMDPASAELQQD